MSDIADYGILATEALLRLHVDAYFASVYHVGYGSFLHRSTLLKSLSSPTTPQAQVLLLALCAVASPFVTSSRHAPADADTWAREAKHLIMDTSDHPSLASISAALLLVIREGTLRRRASVWLLSALVVRLAFILRLNIEPPSTLSWAEQESRRRCMWAAFCLDKLVSVGSAQFIHIPLEAVKVQLPCIDRNFTLQVSCKTSELSDLLAPEVPVATLDSNRGLFAAYIHVQTVRSDVLSFRRTFASDEVLPWDPTSRFSACVASLHRWESCLSPELKWSPSNASARHSINQLSGFVCIHMWYFRTIVDLYSIALPGHVDDPSSLAGAPPEWIETAQKASIQAASCMADVFSRVLEDDPGFASTDPHIGLCILTAVRIQIAWAELGASWTDASSRPQAVKHIEVMLTMLHNMVGTFPSVDALRLEVCSLLRAHGFELELDLEIVPTPKKPPSGDDVFSEKDLLAAADRNLQQRGHSTSSPGEEPQSSSWNFSLPQNTAAAASSWQTWPAPTEPSLPASFLEDGGMNNMGSTTHALGDPNLMFWDPMLFQPQSGAEGEPEEHPLFPLYSFNAF
ncbi:hypothetical protein MNV49_006439 [Pseudohyphozyma bogoriensis]|nr:hypothetical protein MNV49_006439 [Pseudohyphozyma bogoriensis]